MPETTSKRFRITLVFLLILCLSPTAMMTPWLGALHSPGVESKPVFFISASSGGASSAFAARMRSRLADELDDLLKAALIPGRPPILFARKSLPFFEDEAGFVPSMDSMVIPIRAPPVCRFSESD
ncbi:MAG: hypothetical protein C4530_07090 [Desulfobacteraceae bacterium]|nr:MAG: hypothetical protein C4530_07090 [Desulfobacteraceae bacterium]